MMITPAEMRECLQEWYAQALCADDFCSYGERKDEANES